MIMKHLMVECVEALLILNLWNYRMTLALMVGQTCLGQSLEGAAWVVVAMQSSLRVDESQLTTTLLLIFMTPLIVFCFYIEALYTALDGGAPRAMLLDLLSPDFRLHCFRSLATTSFHHRFCPPAKCLPPTGTHMRSCLGSRSLGILERCPRKRR